MPNFHEVEKCSGRIYNIPTRNSLIQNVKDQINRRKSSIFLYASMECVSIRSPVHEQKKTDDIVRKKIFMGPNFTFMIDKYIQMCRRRRLDNSPKCRLWHTAYTYILQYAKLPCVCLCIRHVTSHRRHTGHFYPSQRQHLSTGRLLAAEARRKKNAVHHSASVSLPATA